MSSPFAELQAELPQCNVSVFNILAGLVAGCWVDSTLC